MNKGLRLDLSKVEPYVKVEQELKHMEAMVKVAQETLENRTGAGNDFLGWLDLPVNYDKNEFERIKDGDKNKEKFRCFNSYRNRWIILRTKSCYRNVK